MVRTKGCGCAETSCPKPLSPLEWLSVRVTGARRGGGAGAAVLVSGACSLHTLPQGQAQRVTRGCEVLCCAVLRCKFCCALPACTAMLQRN